MFASNMFSLPACSPLLTHAQAQPKNPITTKEWVAFFQSPHNSAQQKQIAAQDYLDQHCTELDLSSLGWLESLDQLSQYLEHDHQQTCQEFQQYLQARKENTSRQYFPTVSHAFEFLYKVAPTKLVDGAWLYSTLAQFQHASVKPLLYIYLEELGLGNPKANHVCMYQALLAHYELNSYMEHLNDDHFKQASIQLALAYAPAAYLPLVIGFNLGYEQLPLHLLITNYELTELGIDPHYFNVHITIDNAHNGHAQKSIEAFQYGYESAIDRSAYLKMVKQGYLLNDLGESSNSILQKLDPAKQVIQILQQKSVVGQLIHNQKCQFSGQSINEWLSQPEKMTDFLKILMDKGWIKLHEPVENSRFWHLIDDAEGKMFGVFNRTEKQFIRDWIQGAAYSQRLSRARVSTLSTPFSEIDLQLKKTLQKQLTQYQTMHEKVQVLLPYLAPHQHHSAVGLWATQQLSQLLLPFQSMPHVHPAAS